MRDGRALAIAVLLAGCALPSGGDGALHQSSHAAQDSTPVSAPDPSVTRSASTAGPVTPGRVADAATQQNIRRHFRSLKERTAADSWPQKTADGSWRTPTGGTIDAVFVVDRTRPPEADGVPYTAYVSTAEKRYWVYEGGGISGISRWFGPFGMP